MNHGVFCISLDFEKYWGIHDLPEIKSIEHFNRVDEVIEGMLQLFRRYETHVTWATVGLLSYRSTNDLLQENFEQIPYEESQYSPFPLSQKALEEKDASILLGSHNIQEILNTPHQEWASHTFSHFYCLEKGISAEDFEIDCQRMETISQKSVHQFRSVIFPRNQVNDACLSVCKTYKFACYRGNQPNRFWRNSAYQNESIFKRIGRYTDAYFKCSKTRRFKLEDLPVRRGLLNIPASRFLRPDSGRKWLEKRKIKTIKREMFRAAKNKEVYHLWWHPHNFAEAPIIALHQLEELLAYSLVLKEKYNFQSMNMAEIAEYVKK